MFAGVWRLMVALAMVTASAAAIAQPVIPSSALPGRERQQFETPTAPNAQPGGAAISLPGSVAPPGADKTAVVIRSVRVVGSTVYTKDQLVSLYADLVGETTTLQAVYDIAQRITTKYGNDGYVLTRAIVPPQELNPNGANIRIEVIEGYVDQVEWPAQLAKYRDFFSYYANMITGERPSNIHTVERYLLLAADLPGLKFKNSLKPSPQHKGAATLIVEVVEKPLDVLARFDNRGTQSRGPVEFLDSVTFNNLLHAHEALTLTYAAAIPTQELQYGALAYRQVLTPEGFTFFADASYGFGRPGTDILELLKYKTKSAFGEAGFSYPLIRAREHNVTLSALGFASDDRSDILDAPNTRDRLRGVRVKLDADYADILQAVSQFNVTISQGFHGLGSTDNGNPLASRANGRVDFTKFELTASRTQPLPDNFSLLLALYGQYAATPLLSPELCGYGGRLFGRGFEPSAFVSDSCVLSLGEVRRDIATPIADLTQFQLYGFADHGWLHNLASVVGTPVDVDASSVGAGVRLGWQNMLSADLSVARGVQGSTDPWRFYFILTGKY